MKELFRSPDAGRVAAHRAVVEAAGFRCFIRNENTQQSLVAGIATAFFPLPEFWPTLCVVEDEDYVEALALLRDTPDDAASAGTEWKCKRCGEMIPANFERCWNCEAEPP